MCQGFGLIVNKELKAYFMEPDNEGDCSHSDLLKRLGWKENNNIHLRDFVRIEFTDWQSESFRFDEENTLPGWVENNRDEIQNKCIHILNLCAPARAEYENVRAPAWAEYENVCNQARAEYENVCNPAWAELINQFSKIEGYVPERNGVK